MSTSASRSSARGSWFAIARRYGTAAVCAAAFSAVYEHFSHGVYSAFMVGLAAWPLVLGALPALLAALAGAREQTPAARTLAAMAVLTLTLGSLVAGVMEIYGSTSDYTCVYWYVGGALLLLAVVARLVGASAISTSKGARHSL